MMCRTADGGSLFHMDTAMGLGKNAYLYTLMAGVVAFMYFGDICYFP